MKPLTQPLRLMVFACLAGSWLCHGEQAAKAISPLGDVTADLPAQGWRHIPVETVFVEDFSGSLERWQFQGEPDCKCVEIHGERCLIAAKNVEMAIGGTDWRDLHVSVGVALGPGTGSAKVRLGNLVDEKRGISEVDLAVRGQNLKAGSLDLTARYRGEWGFRESGRERPSETYVLPTAEESRREAHPAWHGRIVELEVECCGNRVRWKVDGRLLRESTVETPVTGPLRISLSPETSLHWVRVEKSRNTGRFDPVGLRSYLNCVGTGNGDLGDGHAFWPGAVPEGQDGLFEVRGIPFRLTRNGRLDNVDIGLTTVPDDGEFPEALKAGEFPGAFQAGAKLCIRAPCRYYARLWVLGCADRERGDSPELTVRMFRNLQGACADASVDLPRWDDQTDILGERIAAGSMMASAQVSGEKGGPFLVRVRLNPCGIQDHIGSAADEYFAADSVDLELTRPLRVLRSDLDPAFFGLYPAGPPSSVHIFALTLEESPLEMWVRSGAAGNCFEEPETPTFRLRLTSTASTEQAARVNVAVRDSYGNVTRQELAVSVGPRKTLEQDIRLPQERYGHFQAWFRLEAGPAVLERATSFVYVPPDTRKATWEQSPFGIWNWAGAHYSGADTVRRDAPLYRKLGARWFPFLQASDNHAEILKANKLAPCYAKEDWAKYGFPTIGCTGPSEGPFFGRDDPALGMRQAYGIPEEYWGRPRIQFPSSPGDKAHFEETWQESVKYVSELGARDPNARVCLGHGDPRVLIPFIEHGFPKELLADGFGIDVPLFERMPERQPRGVENSGLFFLREAQKRHGYLDVPVTLNESMYHCSGPGSLSEREQAAYYVRSHAIVFAFGAKRCYMVAMIPGAAGEYGRMHYGASGLVYPAPEMRPKVAVAAYSTMTRMLDAAAFDRFYRTGSLSAFALCFKRKWKGPVLLLWTLRGRRPMNLRLARDLTTTVTDMFSNAREAASANAILNLTVTPEPVWLEGITSPDDVLEVQAGQAEFDARPSKTAVLVEDFEGRRSWKPEKRPYPNLEVNNFDLPRVQGKILAGLVDCSERGGKTRGMEFVLSPPAQPIYLAPLYTVFRPPKPVTLPGSPTKLGVWVRGSSSWARVIPELTDAAGTRWTMIGPKDQWNSDDKLSWLNVCFDGWRYCSAELPTVLGTADGSEFRRVRAWRRDGTSVTVEKKTGIKGPAVAFWRTDAPDGKEDNNRRFVRYPLSLTGLIVELRTHNVYVNELVSVADPSIRIDDLHCEYEELAPHEGEILTW